MSSEISATSISSNVQLVNLNDWFNPAWGGGFNATFRYTLRPEDLSGSTVSAWTLLPNYEGKGAVSNAWLDGFAAPVSVGSDGEISTADQDFQRPLAAGDTITFTIQVQGAGFDADDFAFAFAFADLDEPATTPPGPTPPDEGPFVFGDGDDVIDLVDGSVRIDAGGGDNIVTTGSGDDTIVAGDGDDSIDAGDGDNEVRAGGGDDTVRAGDGDDLIFGQGGDDVIDAGDGDNEIHAGGGDDTVTAGDGDDRIFGKSGDDVIDAGDGDNEIHAGRGNDTVTSGDGDDRIFTRGGNDNVTYGGGSDSVFLGLSNDTLRFVWAEAQGEQNDFRGGRGTDTFEIVLTADEAKDGDVRSDIAGLKDAIDAGSRYDFASFDTTVRQFEIIEIVAPAEAFDDAVTTDEDSVVEIDVLANDLDLLGDVANLADDNADLTVVAFDDSGVPDGAAVSLDADGQTIVFDPGTAYQSLAADETAEVEIGYTVEDDQGFTAEAVLTVTITGDNDDPVANGDGPFSVDEDGTIVIPFVDLLGNDTDAEGDTLTIEGFDDVDTAGDVTDNGDGTFTYDPAGAFAFLSAGETDTDTFVYLVSDGNGGTAEATVTISIDGADDPVGVVLDFDDIGTDLGEPVPDGYGGLNWTNAFILNTLTYQQNSGYIRGNTSGDFVVFNGDELTLGVDDRDGDEFFFVGVTLTAAWKEDLSIEIIGFRDGVPVESTTVVVSDDAPTEFLLNWGNVDRLTFFASGGSDAGTPGRGDYFAMDDFVVA